MCEQALKHDPGTLQSMIGEFVHHKQSNHCAFCYQQKHDPRTLQSMICESMLQSIEAAFFLLFTNG